MVKCDQKGSREENGREVGEGKDQENRVKINKSLERSWNIGGVDTKSVKEHLNRGSPGHRPMMGGGGG